MTLSDGTVRYRSGNNSEVPYQGLQTIAAWIRRADKYSGYEKSGMECVVAANDVVIDLEMGIPWWPEQSTGAGTPERTGKYAPRMDMVALEDGPGGRIDIVFWEAKTLGDSRLRSRSNPEVIRQLQVYNKYLSRPRLPGRGFRSLCRDVQAFGDHPSDGCGASQRNSAPAARQHCVPDCGGSRNSCSRFDAEAVDIPLRVWKRENSSGRYQPGAATLRDSGARSRSTASTTRKLPPWFVILFSPLGRPCWHRCPRGRRSRNSMEVFALPRASLWLRPN